MKSEITLSILIFIQYTQHRKNTKAVQKLNYQ